MKKIFFNDMFGQTGAVIRETKTMFRRIVPQKAFDSWNDIDDGDEYSRSVYAASYDEKMCNFLLKYAQYKVGEVVAVAMAYKSFYEDFKEPLRTELVNSAGFFNKMFVKAKLMPYKIVITSVKVERLQDIPDYSCIEEGVIKYANSVYTYIEDGKKIFRAKLDTPKKAFADLIDKINGKGTWESNPFVFCYTFQLVKL